MYLPPESALAGNPTPAATLAPGITAAVALCDLGAPMAEPPPLPLAGIDDDWRRVLVRLSEAMEAIRELREAVPPA